MPPPPVSRLLGLRLVSAAEGEAVFELEVVPEHANPMGTLQGGVICALADAAMGMAYASRGPVLPSRLTSRTGPIPATVQCVHKNRMFERACGR